MVYKAADLLPYLDRVIDDIDLPDGPNRHSGKVRESFDLPDGKRLIVTTDRLSAFDRRMANIPFKGRVLNILTGTFFGMINGDIEHHMVGMPHPNMMVVRKLNMLPLEIVVRNCLAGNTETSIWTMYARGERDMYGYKLPDGLRQYQTLPFDMVTPTTKGAAHDIPLSAADIVNMGMLTQEEWMELYDKSLRAFEIARNFASNRGLILADTKYEWGRDPETGRFVLADEIHTPDSSRYWYADSFLHRIDNDQPPESFDKDVIRRWVGAHCDPYHQEVPPIPPEVIAEASAVYLNCHEKIMGTALALENLPENPAQHLAGKVRSWLAENYSA
jgi:phosphoribosylaminoimidazole-succinocarboxamide synthase